jgi:hypothetical protein
MLAPKQQQEDGEDSDDDDTPAEEPCCGPGVGLHFVFECLVKLNLEVFGAGGAVWGFSDACALRNAHNNETWRLAALVTGGVFFLRWCLYIVQHLNHTRLYVYTHTRTTENIVFRKHAKTHKRALNKLKTAALMSGGWRSLQAATAGGATTTPAQQAQFAGSPRGVRIVHS